MKIKNVFSPSSSDTKLLEPDEKRIYHLPAILLGILFFSILSIILLKLHFYRVDFNYVWQVHNEIQNGTHPIILKNYAQTMLGMNDLSSFYPIIRMCFFISFIAGFVVYRITLHPTRDIKILNNGYFYNRYDDAANIYKIETVKRTGVGSKIQLIKEGDYTENLTKFTERVYLSKREEEKGIFVTAIAGQGKTVLLNNFILDIFNQQDNSICILHNVKGDELKYVRKFSTYYNISTTRYADEKIHAIDYLSLIKDPDPVQQEAKIAAFTTSFVGAPEGADKFWKTGANDIIKAVKLEALSRNPKAETYFDEIENCWNGIGIKKIDSSNNNIDEELTEEEKKTAIQYLRIYLEKHNPVAASYVDEKSEKTSTIMIASCIEAIKKISMLNQAWKRLNARYIDIKKDFILNGEKNCRRFLVLTNDPNTPELCNAYISSIINLLTIYTTSQQYENPHKRNIYFLLDEFPQLSAINAKTFMKLPDVGRSKGIRVILAAQKFSQIKSNFNYNEEDFSASFPIKILGQLGESDYEIVKKIVGQVKIKRWFWKDDKKINDEQTVNSLEFSDLKTAGPVITQSNGNSVFWGVKLFYVIPGHHEIFSIITSPVDTSKVEEEFKIKLKESNAAMKKKALEKRAAKKQKELEAPTAQNLVLDMPTLANAQETSPSPATAVPEAVEPVSQVDSQEADHLQPISNEVSDLEDILNILENNNN